MTSECKEILDFLKCKYILFENQENNLELIQRYNELSVEGKSSGYIPLIITPSIQLTEQLEFEEEYDREQIIAEAGIIDVQTFFTKRLEEYMEHEDVANITGKFIDCQPSRCLYSYTDGAKPEKEILIVKIPTVYPWELAAWVPMGGFNDCPFPQEQAAIFKYWFEQYGAVPASVTYDIWEMDVQRPVTTKEDAEKLAKEQFAFCSDTVFQVEKGWDSIRGHASILMNSTTWYFWWD